MSHWIIDRMEGNWVVCEKEDGIARLDRTALPEKIREGDCLFLDEEGNWHIDEEETCQRRQKAAQKLRALFHQSEEEKAQ